MKSLELKIYKSKDFFEFSISDNITAETGEVLYYGCWMVSSYSQNGNKLFKTAFFLWKGVYKNAEAHHTLCSLWDN